MEWLSIILILLFSAFAVWQLIGLIKDIKKKKVNKHAKENK